MLGPKLARRECSAAGRRPGPCRRRRDALYAGRPWPVARAIIFAGFGTRCEPVAAPKITITAPPAKGEVSFGPGQETTIQYSAQGTCIGQNTKTTGIY